MVKAEAIGHGYAAAVRVEGAQRIDLQVALPVESRSFVTDADLDASIQAFESDLGPLRIVFRQCQPPSHFGCPIRHGFQP